MSKDNKDYLGEDALTDEQKAEENRILRMSAIVLAFMLASGFAAGYGAYSIDEKNGCHKFTPEQRVKDSSVPDICKRYNSGHFFVH